MTYECGQCGTVFDADRAADAICPSCQRARTRADVEIDTLVAMATTGPVCRLGLAWLTVEDFTVGDHRVLFKALGQASPDPTEVDEWMARLVGCSISEALDRRMASSPCTPRDDIALLVGLR